MSPARAAAKSGAELRLVPDLVSQDTVACLEELLRRARRGEVVGMAYCAQLKGRAYIVDAAGVTRDSPTFARGMVRALDDLLSGTIHRGA